MKLTCKRARENGEQSRKLLQQSSGSSETHSLLHTLLPGVLGSALFALHVLRRASEIREGVAQRAITGSSSTRVSSRGAGHLPIPLTAPPAAATFSTPPALKVVCPMPAQNRRPRPEAHRSTELPS
ncbi:hypothetical protein NDU88_010963 [Pleurodeles waltl]|uniref:Uncharacterized protein n=1 Tax=Pleurodeles waltl TaxID=8319 RepID=A0AAV7QVU4_PLEWA|nr:hypothetical protein NDU88_010963 [Pleurodeles waltl]